MALGPHHCLALLVQSRLQQDLQWARYWTCSPYSNHSISNSSSNNHSNSIHNRIVLVIVTVVITMIVIVRLIMVEIVTIGPPRPSTKVSEASQSRFSRTCQRPQSIRQGLHEGLSRPPKEGRCWKHFFCARASCFCRASMDTGARCRLRRCDAVEQHGPAR